MFCTQQHRTIIPNDLINQSVINPDVGIAGYVNGLTNSKITIQFNAFYRKAYCTGGYRPAFVKLNILILYLKKIQDLLE